MPTYTYDPYAYQAPGSKCLKKAQPGTQILWNTITAMFPGVRSSGIYNCRNVRGGSGKSLHAEGRALDIQPRYANYVGKKKDQIVPTEAYKADGDEIAAWLVQNAGFLGIQEVIWWEKRWAVNTGEWRDYNGQSPHKDHIHIGQNWWGAHSLNPEWASLLAWH